VNQPSQPSELQSRPRPGSGDGEIPLTALPQDAPALLLFGGSFDPPHTAHVDLADQARRACLPEGSWVVFVPAARSPHKTKGPAASDTQRVTMLQIATSGIDRTSIWTDELTREPQGQASYWIDTVQRARRAVPERTKLYFLLGADQVAAFHRWREHRAILELAEPVVMLRPPMQAIDTLDAALEASGAWTTTERAWWLERVAPIATRAISATELRAVIASGGDPTGMLHPGVLSYIQQQGLYRSQG
jgi:nicotinate-nucleotide adenylyltransferase